MHKHCYICQVLQLNILLDMHVCYSTRLTASSLWQRFSRQLQEVNHLPLRQTYSSEILSFFCISLQIKSYIHILKSWKGIMVFGRTERKWEHAAKNNKTIFCVSELSNMIWNFLFFYEMLSIVRYDIGKIVNIHIFSHLIQIITTIILWILLQVSFIRFSYRMFQDQWSTSCSIFYLILAVVEYWRCLYASPCELWRIYI